MLSIILKKSLACASLICLIVLSITLSVYKHFSSKSCVVSSAVIPVSGYNHAYLNARNSVESEAGRCRRTDGKKWRCKGGVLPGQKYCATHVNRGAKKRVTSHEPAATTTSTTYPSATTNNIQKAQITNLSMSVPAASAAAAAALTQSQCNVKSASSNDTDITISDTINECNNYLSS